MRGQSGFVVTIARDCVGRTESWRHDSGEAEHDSGDAEGWWGEGWGGMTMIIRATLMTLENSIFGSVPLYVCTTVPTCIDWHL